MAETVARKKRSRKFHFVRILARTMLRSQYRRIEVEDADRVPAEGAVLLVANHFSSIVDSMALLHASPRPASFLAKAPLWKSRLLKPFLEAVEAVPVYRPQDAGENKGRGVRANMKTFASCRKRLEAGGSMAIFPEGVSQPQPRLMPLRTGAARIALDAKVPVAVVPVGLVFEPARADRRGTLLARFGRPIMVEGWEGHASRRAAITALTRNIEKALRDLIAEARSQSELEALHAMRVVWDQERGRSLPRTLIAQHRRHRVFARGLERLRETEPEVLETLLAGADAYKRALHLAGIPPYLLQGRYTFGRVAHFLLTKGVATIIGQPIAWLAAILTWPGRRLGDILALRSFGGAEDVRSLCRMLGGGLMLVLLMFVGSLAAWLLWSPWAALAVFLGLPALLAYHVAWQDHWRDVRTRTRAFFLLAGAELRKTLRARRRRLYERLLSVADALDRES